MVAGLDQVVTVVIKARDEATGRLKAVEKRVTSLSRGLGVANETMKKRIKVDDKWRTVQSKTTKGMRKFNMELLSTMFFGMAVQKAVTGLLSPALKASGIFDLWGTTLQVLFLPVAIMLLDILLPIMEWFMNLPKPVKEAIGIFVVIIGILAMLMMVGSQIGLVLGPLMAFFGVTTLAALAPIIAIILLIIAAVVFLALAWKNNWGNMRTNIETVIGGIKKVINGVVTFIKGVFETIWGLITGDPEMVAKGWEKIKDGIMGVVEGFKDIGTGIMNAIVDGIKASYNMIKTAIEAIPVLGPLLIKGIEKIEGLAAAGFAAVKGAIKGVLGLQEGGIVTRPTLAMIGEAGPEAVVPLGGGGAGGIGGITIINEFHGITDKDSIIREINSSTRTELESIMRR